MSDPMTARQNRDSARDVPIIFSAAMIKALLEGRKTMTRRLAWSLMRGGIANACKIEVPSPWTKVKAGDRLWVRESFCLVGAASHPYVHFDQYNPAKPTQSVMHRTGCWNEWPKQVGYGGWKPSIHMPRWASRLTLTVTETKIERLQEISEEDARAEGVQLRWLRAANCAPRPHFFVPVDGEREHSGGSATEAFERLWEALHGPESWAANPELVCLTFRVHKANIDTLKREAA